MIPYLLHTALLTSLLYLAYFILLKKETFFKLNRLVLAISILIAFMLPLIPIPAEWSWKGESRSFNKPDKTAHIIKEKALVDQEHLTILSPETENAPVIPSYNKEKSYSIWSILFLIYWIGVLVMAVNLFIQLASLVYQMFAKPNLQDGLFRIVELDNDKAPFSFANSIFINPSKYDWDTYNQIIEHEKTHIEQGHSFDILLAELLVVIQWFNPFAWMLRKSVEDNLEYLTDECMIAKGVNKETYQMNLLKVSVPYHPLSPSNNYNQSTLKSRITMMNLKKSSLSSSWKYLCVMAMFGLSTVFFNPTIASAKSNEQQSDTPSVTEQAASADLMTVSREFPNKGIWSATIEGNELCIKYDLSDHKRNNWWVTTKCYATSEFANLPMGKEGDFTLKREAGTINFNGKFENNDGLGRFTFAPDESFRSLLLKEGYSKVSDEVLFGFTLSNIDRAYWAYLKQEGLTPQNEDELEDIGHHLPVLATLKRNLEGYKQLGFSQLSLEELVDLSIHDVSPDFIRSIQQLGFKNLSLEEYEEAKIHNINAAFIAEMKELGFKDLTFEELEELRIHGVNKEFVDLLKKAGYNNLSAEEVAEAKIHNVSPTFAAEMKELGFDNLTLEELQELKIHGISKAYVEELKKAGFNKLTAEEVTEAKIHNVSTAFAAEMKALGFNNLSLEELQDLSIHGINKAYVEELKKAGFNNLTAEEVTEAKIHNLNTKFVQEMANLGYKDASLEELMEASIHGLTSGYAKSLQEEGLNNMSLETLVELKIHGVTSEFIRKVKGLGMTNLSAKDYMELKIMGLEEKMNRKREE